MDQDSMVKDQIEGGARFLGEFSKTTAISAAFWLQSREDDFHYLYVVPERLIDENQELDYGEVIRIAGQLRDPRFDPFRVKLIKPTHPAAKAACELLQLYPGQHPIRLHRRNLGGLPAEAVYIYPKPLTSSPVIAG